MTWAVITALFVFFLAIGMPIAFVLGVTGMVALLLLLDPMMLLLVPQQIFQGMDSFVLLAIPFFIFAGELMNLAGITDKIVALANAMVGHFRGGLAHVTIVASILFAGISGAAVADVAALGAILIPAMTKSGYSKPYATAVTASASIIGPTIPPSIPMIIYGAVTNVSIAGLFAAGVIPGLMMGVLMMVANYVISRRRGYQASSERLPVREVAKTVKDGLLALGMPLVILGGILGGIFTPTEAAAVAVLYALLVGGLVFGTLTVANVWATIKRCVYTSGVALLLVSMGGILSWILASEQIPNLIAREMLQISHSTGIFLLLCVVLLLLVGCVMDLTASIVILAPILAPIAVNLGIHPLQFGIVMVVALNIGLNTPPVGAVLFVASSIAKEPIESIVREILPFLLCEVVILLLVAFWTDFSLVIPEVLGFYRPG